MRSALLAIPVLLAACGGTPRVVAPPPPPPTTPQARATQCKARVAARPDDADAHRCWREAATRTRTLPAVISALSAAREAQPDQPKRWLFEVRARMHDDLDAAVRVAGQCHERLGDVPDCLLADGLARARAGDTARALIFAEKVASDRPSATAWALLARLRTRIDDVEGAAIAVAAALKLDSADPEVLAAAARVAIAQRDLVRAEAHLANAMARAPDAADPLVMRARLNLLRNQGADAKADLREAVSLDPTHARARDALSRMLLDDGQTEAAIEHLNLLVDQHPRQARFMVRLGEALLRTGNAERALGWADLALGNDADDLDALTLRVRALIRTGAHDAAAQARARIFEDGDVPKRRILIAREWARAGQSGRAESAFAEATAQHPDDPRVWQAYADWCVRRDNLGRAGTLLRRGIEVAPKSAALHADLANVLERAERRGDARLAMAEAARLDPEDPDHPDELARMEFLDRDVQQAIGRWEKVLTDHPRAHRARLRLSQAYRAVGQFDKALTLLENLTEVHPKDATLLGHLGEVLLMSKRKREAVPVLQRALSNGGDANTLQPLLAAALADTGETAQARTAFEAALQSNPGNRALRMTYARFLGRQGDATAAAAQYRAQLARDPNDAEARSSLVKLGQSAARPSWPAAAPYPELRALAARAPIDGEGGATVLRDERYVTVNPDGVAQVRHVRSILVRKAAGLKRHGEARISFHAASMPTVVRARTLSPDGRAIPVPQANRAVVNPHAGTPLYGDARTLTLKFAQVEPGAIIDYEVITRDPRPDLKGIWWDGYILGNLDPTLQVRYALDLPAGLEVQVAAPKLGKPAVRTIGDRRVMTWDHADLPAYDFGRATASQVPAVYVSNLRDWADVDRWYASLFSPQSKADDAIRARAEALVKGKSDRRAKVAAIYRFVEQHVDYLGIEFGIGAYRPRPANATLARAKGDCKDMTALMVALLDVVGIKAYPALVRPRSQGGFVPGHASPGQFSHVLLYVPDKKGDMWLDATSGLSTLAAVPGTLRGQRALIVDGKGGQLKTIPDGRARTHTVEQTTAYTLTPTGGGTLSTRLKMIGDQAGLSRRKLLAVDPSRREALLAAPGYLLGNARVPAAVKWSGLDDPEAPLIIEATQEDPDLVAVRLDGALVLPFHLRVVADSPIATSPPETWFETPRVFERHLTLTAPGKYRFNWEPLRYTDRAGPVQISVRETRAGQTTRIVTRLTVDRGRLVSAERAQLVVALRRAEAQMERRLEVLPGPDFDALGFMHTVARERPRDPRIQMHYGRLLLDANRPLEARAALERARAADPDQPAIHALLAATYVRTGDFVGAEAPLRALARSPDAAPTVYGTLGMVLIEQSRAADAAEVLAEGIARFPEEPRLRRAHIGALSKAGKPNEALRAARRLLIATPDDAEVYALIGDLSTEIGATQDAEDAFRRALALRPKFPRIMNNLAWLMRDDPARRAEAVAMARKSLALDPASAATWDTLAELLFMTGDAAGAIKAITQAEARARDAAQKAFYAKRRAKYEAARQGPERSTP